MYMAFALAAAAGLAGCGSLPDDAAADEAGPLVTLECLQRRNPPKDRPFEWCRVDSVTPDTPATRRFAEAFVARVGRSERRPPADKLFGAQTLKYRIRLSPGAEGRSDPGGDVSPTPR